MHFGNPLYIDMKNVKDSKSEAIIRFANEQTLRSFLAKASSEHDKEVIPANIEFN